MSTRFIVIGVKGKDVFRNVYNAYYRAFTDATTLQNNGYEVIIKRKVVF